MIKIFNPFSLYCISWILSLTLYSLKWSDLFPKLKSNFLVFIVVTLLISFLFSIILLKNRKKIITHLNINYKSIKKRFKIILLLYLIEIIYSRNIPLFSIFTSSDSFTHFGGIPTIHVFLTTYTVFFTIESFQVLLENYNKRMLILFISILVIPPILTVNRGMLLSSVISCMTMYFATVHKLKKKQIISGILITCLVLWGFGIIGKYRIKDEADKIFTAYTQPSDKFEKTGLNSIVLWPYMYIASPIGNLQLCIDRVNPEYSIYDFMISCILPDFIAKRIDSDYKTDSNAPLISPTFNVCTLYYNAYRTLGYFGMIIIFSYQCIIIFILLLATSPKRNRFYLIDYSVLNTIVILGIFSNMWVFSAISFPLVWGIILNFKIKKIW